MSVSLEAAPENRITRAGVPFPPGFGSGTCYNYAGLTVKIKADTDLTDAKVTCDVMGSTAVSVDGDTITIQDTYYGGSNHEPPIKNATIDSADYTTATKFTSVTFKLALNGKSANKTVRLV